MTKKIGNKLIQGNGNPLSQFLIIATVILVLIASMEAVTQIDFTKIAPTQLFLVALVLGVLGLYLKDEK